MPEKNKDVKQSKWPVIISVTMLISLVGAYFFIPSLKQFLDNAFQVLTSDDEERITEWVSQLGFWGPFIVVIGMVAQIFLLVIPSFLLMIISVLAYGPIWGSLLVLVAIFTASSVGYVIGSFLGDFTVKKLVGEKSQEKVESYVEVYGLWAVFVTRISPLISNDAISLVAGLLNLSYIKFIGATMAGILPLTVLIAILGEEFDTLVDGLIWISVGSILGLIAYIIYDRKKHHGD